MKLDRLFSFVLAISALSLLPSALVHAKKHSIKNHDTPSKLNDSMIHDVSSTAIHHNMDAVATLSGDERGATSEAVFPTTSSSLHRRSLKKSSSGSFFFEECSHACATNASSPTMPGDNCCKGGASYIRVIFNAPNVGIPGTITLDPIVAENFTDYSNTSSPCKIFQYNPDRGSKGLKNGISPLLGSKGLKAGSSQPSAQPFLGSKAGSSSSFPPSPHLGSKAGSSTSRTASHLGSKAGSSSSQAPSHLGSKAGSSSSQAPPHLGSKAGSSSTSQPSSYLGSKAGSSSSSQAPSHLGSKAGSSSTSQPSLYLGSKAGSSSTSQPSSYLGSKAGSSSSSQAPSHLGSKAGSSSTSQPSSYLGSKAGSSSSSQAPSHLGSKAGSSSTSQPSLYLGSKAGSSSTSQPSSYLGSKAGSSSSSQAPSHLGSKAGSSSSSQAPSHLGSKAGSSSTSQPSSYLESKGSKADSTQSPRAYRYLGSSAGSSQFSHTLSGSKGTKVGSQTPKIPLYLGSKGTKTGFSESSGLRIVDCNDPCIKFPFDGHSCSKPNLSHTKTDIQSGDEICFAMVDSLSNEISLDVKMPTNFYVWFSSGQGEVLVGVIHTSCSVSLSPPYGVSLVDACSPNRKGLGKRPKTRARNRHIDVNNNLTDPHLAFVDGISTRYFSSVKTIYNEEDAESYVQAFSIGFGNCGCTCDSFNMTSPTGAPIVPLTSNPSSTPTVGPILTPTSNPTGAPIVPLTPNPSSTPTVASILTPTSNPTDIPTMPLTPNPSPTPTVAPSHAPTSDPSLLPTGSPSPFPTTEPSSIPVIAPSVQSQSFAPFQSESPTFVSSAFSSWSSSSDRGLANPGPAALPTSCSSTCMQYILEQCVFTGTPDPCDANAGIPVLDEDDEEEQIETAETATLFPGARNGKSGKGSKGKGDYGKSLHEKSGKKMGKGYELEEGKAGEKRGSKLEKKYSRKSEIKMAESNGKGGKAKNSGVYFYYSGNKRRLEQIEYHQSRIDHLKDLLKHAED